MEKRFQYWFHNITLHFLFQLPPVCVCVCVHGAVTSLKRETDALKLASVRAGLLELSQSWASLGRKCALLAESQMVRHNVQGVNHS